jgi:hypothetical protein
MGKIDAVRMVREIRDRQYAETRGKTRKELQRYYKEKAGWAFAKAAEKSAMAHR